MNDQQGDRDGGDFIDVGKTEGPFRFHRPDRYAEPLKEPQGICKTAFYDHPLYPILMMKGDLTDGGASEGSPHQERFPREPLPAQDLAKGLKYYVSVSDHCREGRSTGARAISPIIGHKEVYLSLIIERRQVVVVAHDLSISVKIEEIWGIFAGNVETASDHYPIIHTDRMILPVGL